MVWGINKLSENSGNGKYEDAPGLCISQERGQIITFWNQCGYPNPEKLVS